MPTAAAHRHDTPETSEAPIPRQPWEILCVSALVVYFVARLLYFAVSITPELPPDESSHLGIIRLYANTAFLIDDSPESYRFGVVTRQPHLYYFLLGKLAALNVLDLEEVLYLRLINVVLAALTVVVGYRLASRLSGDPLVRIAFLVMITNTLMFTFLGAAVSYDNLVNLLAVSSVAAFIGFTRTGAPLHLWLFLLWNLLGTWTKATFLPLTLILVILLVIDRRRHLRGDFTSLGRSLRGPAWRNVVLLTLVLSALGANLWVYGLNLVRYGRPTPRCTQVLEVDQCMENRIYARNRIVSQYRDDALTFEQALAATSRIDHPGDRDHAIRLLQNERAYKATRPKPLPRWDYVQLVWTQAMKPSIFGIQAHVSMLKDPWALLPYNLILFAVIVLWIRGVGRGGGERPWVYLSAVAVCYFLFLIGYVNYRYYITSHAPFLGVQGRYLFPVLVPAYLVAARFLLEPFRRRARIAIVVVLFVIFVAGDLPYFLRHDGPDWHASSRATVESASLGLASR